MNFKLSEVSIVIISVFLLLSVVFGIIIGINAFQHSICDSFSQVYPDETVVYVNFDGCYVKINDNMWIKREYLPYIYASPDFKNK